jgi:hypothetical protein
MSYSLPESSSLLSVKQFAGFFFGHSAKTFFAECKKNIEQKKLKSNFEALNECKSTSFQLQSCITSQDI